MRPKSKVFVCAQTNIVCAQTKASDDIKSWHIEATIGTRLTYSPHAAGVNGPVDLSLFIEKKNPYTPHTSGLNQTTRLHLHVCVSVCVWTVSICSKGITK